MTTIWITIAFAVGFSGLVYARSEKNVPQINVTITINTSIDSAFNYIVPVNLSHIFKRYKRMPAIIKTNEPEKWFKAGLTRTIFFEDGSTSKEKLLTVIPHTSFSYEIDSFTSQLRFFAKRIEGKWLFIDLGNRQTKIEWTYIIVPKNSIARILIKMIVVKDMVWLLNNALSILKEDLEGGNIKIISH